MWTGSNFESAVGARYVAILREDNSVKETFKKNEYTKKPVWLGFEIKLHWSFGARAKKLKKK